jgi:hypothetical protein
LLVRTATGVLAIVGRRRGASVFVALLARLDVLLMRAAVAAIVGGHVKSPQFSDRANVGPASSNIVFFHRFHHKQARSNGPLDST